MKTLIHKYLGDSKEGFYQRDKKKLTNFTTKTNPKNPADEWFNYDR